MTGASSGEQVLCRLEDIADGESRGLLPDGIDHQLFAVRQGDNVHVYVNSCPHDRRPLQFRRDRFLSASGDNIMCYAHGARFDIDTGRCISGPCFDDYLVKVAARIDQGNVLIPIELPKHQG